jgi:NADH:ubiquinone oxidoreductase subunit 6 (subunit J)
MSIQQIAYYFFLVLAAASAISILFVKNVFKGALLLLVCLLSIASLYVFMFAEFVAVTQIMIYAGGVVIVIIFGIMLTTRLSDEALKVGHTNIFSGILVSASLLILLLKFFTTSFSNVATGSPTSDAVTDVGTALMTSHLLPFEIAGVFLLMALIGAAMVVSSANKPSKP